jgi:Helix-turn-helix domain
VKVGCQHLSAATAAWLLAAQIDVVPASTDFAGVLADAAGRATWVRCGVRPTRARRSARRRHRVDPWAAWSSVARRASLDRQIGALRTERVDVTYRENVRGKSVKQWPSDRGALIKVLHKPTSISQCRWVAALSPSYRQWPRLSVAGSFKRAKDAAKPRPRLPARKPKLSDHQRGEALKRLDAGESCREIAKAFRMHHATIARLAA